MNDEPKIAAVVVTYNRKKLLLECLRAIESQSLRPNKIYIIDNASTDGTDEEIQQYKFILPHQYIRLEENIGGAGGFYTGIKTAHETNEFDGVWVMDDDGVPDKECLKNLSKYIQSGFVAPLVLALEDHEKIAFPYVKEKTYKEITAKYGENGIIQNYASPFNGILFSKNFIDNVGYPKKEMFIWGDEIEYKNRAIKKGYQPITVITALHFHPQDRQVLYKDFLGRNSIVYVDSKIRRYCKYRNSAYTIKKYNRIISFISYVVTYSYFYLISRKCDIKGWNLFLRAVLDGTRENFSRHTQYK